jgi:hypothetical protein
MDPSAVDKKGAAPFVAATAEQDNRSHQRFSGEGLSLREREWEEAHAHDPPPMPDPDPYATARQFATNRGKR